MDTFFIICLFIGVIIAILIIQDKIEDQKYNNYRTISECITYDKTNNTATLHKRSSISSSILSVDPLYDVAAKYCPAQIKYTGVSGGGLSFGETTFEPAAYEAKVQGKTGKYRLNIKYDKQKYQVNEIILTPDVLQDAKNDSKIKKFLVGNKLVLQYNNKDCKATALEAQLMKQALESRDEGALVNASRRVIIAKALTLDDCNYIKSWICGN